MPGTRLPPFHIFGGYGAALEGVPNTGGGWKICAPLSRHAEAVKGWTEQCLCGPSRAGRAPWRAAPLPHAPAGSWPSPDILHRFAQPCRSCSQAPAGISHSGWGSPFPKASWQHPAGGRDTVRSSPLGCWAGSGTQDGSVVPEPLEKAFCQFARAAEGLVAEDLEACAGPGLLHMKPGGEEGVPSCLPGADRHMGALSWCHRAVPTDAGIALALRCISLILYPDAL